MLPDDRFSKFRRFFGFTNRQHHVTDSNINGVKNHVGFFVSAFLEFPNLDVNCCLMIQWCSIWEERVQVFSWNISICLRSKVLIYEQNHHEIILYKKNPCDGHEHKKSLKAPPSSHIEHRDLSIEWMTNDYISWPSASRVIFARAMWPISDIL